MRGVCSVTTIAWDGKNLAADKQATWNDRAHVVTKIREIGRTLYGLSGSCELFDALVKWHQLGADTDSFPNLTDHQEATFIAIDSDGCLTLYCGTGHGSQFDESNQFAIGSGQDYAMAAMKFGKTAEQAVELACTIDLYSGCGVDTLELK